MEDVPAVARLRGVNGVSVVDDSESVVLLADAEEDTEMDVVVAESVVLLVDVEADTEVDVVVAESVVLLVEERDSEVDEIVAESVVLLVDVDEVVAESAVLLVDVEADSEAVVVEGSESPNTLDHQLPAVVDADAAVTVTVTVDVLSVADSVVPGRKCAEAEGLVVVVSLAEESDAVDTVVVVDKIVVDAGLSVDVALPESVDVDKPYPRTLDHHPKVVVDAAVVMTVEALSEFDAVVVVTAWRVAKMYGMNGVAAAVEYAVDSAIVVASVEDGLNGAYATAVLVVVVVTDGET
ncbi:hypothetical protein HK101_006680 [Irineochytrium annulatum]|nr:hypothetical protein HK101_006680 [Irineochytrium annulatum]